jgi:hypothetical protein
MGGLWRLWSDDFSYLCPAREESGQVVKIIVKFTEGEGKSQEEKPVVSSSQEG